MGFFGDLLGGLTGYQTSNPLANSFQSGMNEVGGAITQGQGDVNSAITQNGGTVNSALNNGTAAVNQSGANVNAATGQANGTLQSLLNGQNQNLASGIQSGVQGNTSLQQYAASNPQFNFQPTQQQLENTPGYQFQLQQGENAITNSAAAQGLSQGGSTLAALTQYGQGLAGTYYQNAFNNAQSQFQTNQNATLGNLSALIGSGNTANAQSLGAATTLGAPQASNTINAANTNAGLQQYLATLNTGGQQGLAGQNLQGQEFNSSTGLTGNTTIAGLNVGAGQAQEAQMLGNSSALGSGVIGGLNAGLNGGGLSGILEGLIGL